MSIKKFVLIPFEKYQSLIKSNDILSEGNNVTQVGGSTNTVIDPANRLHNPPPPGLPAASIDTMMDNIDGVQSNSDNMGTRITAVGDAWAKDWISL